MTAKIIVRVALVVVSAAMFQRGLFTQITIAGVQGDVLLLLAIAGGIALGPDRGAIIGFIAGLTFDLFLYSPLGLRALVFCLVGLRRRALPELGHPVLAVAHDGHRVRRQRRRPRRRCRWSAGCSGRATCSPTASRVIVLVISADQRRCCRRSPSVRCGGPGRQPRDHAPYGAVTYGR